MERKDDVDKEKSLLLDIGIGMIGLSLITQIVLLVLANDLGYRTLGLWLGTGIGFGMFVHMKRSIEDALDIGEENAAKYMIKKSVLRSAVVIAAFFLIGYFQIGSLLTALIGILGLKISVYLQPYIYKVRIYLQRNLRKGG